MNSPAQPAPAGRPSSVRYFVIAFLCAAAAFAYIQRSCIATAESTIRAELGWSKYQMGLMMSAFFWAYAFFQIPSGWLGDRWGSRAALPLYSTSWSAATVLTALSGTAVTAWLAAGTGFEGAAALIAWQWFLAARFFAGAAQAGIFPCAAAIVAAWYPTSWRAAASGYIASAQQVGAIAALIMTAGLRRGNVLFVWID